MTPGKQRLCHTGRCCATNLPADMVVRADSVYGHLIPAITRYLLFRRQHDHYASTASSGLVLTTILPALLAARRLDSSGRQTFVKMSGSLKDSATSFPRTYALKAAHPRLVFEKKGRSPVYIAVVYQYPDSHPVQRVSDFSVRSY